MSIDLGRRLIAVGLVGSREVEAALFISVARGVPLARVLLDRGAISERALEEELEHAGGLGLRRVVYATELVARLPKAMCRRLAALPTRLDPETNTVDIVAADPLDPHIASEFAFHLGTAIRVFHARIAEVEDAIRRLELEEVPEAQATPAPPAEVRPRRMTPPFPHGAPDSVQPPLTEHTPIPLVKRIEDMTPSAPEVESIPMPLRVVKPLPAPEPEPEAPLPLRRTKTHDRPSQPSISFPSEPPPHERAPDSALRIAPPETPPYGMPAVPRLVPPAPGATREPRPTRRGIPVLQPPSPEADAGPRPTIKGFVTPTPMLDWGADDSPRPTIRGFAMPMPMLDWAPDDEPTVMNPPPSDAVVTPKMTRAPDGTPVLAALQRVEDRDEVVRLAMRGMRLVARRIAVFAVRRDGFHGWSCNVEFGDPEALRALMIPHELPSVLATAAAAEMYLGPIPRTPAHDGLLRVMDHSSKDVVALSVRVGGRAAMILVADELDDTLIGTRWMEELAEAIGEALSRVLSVKG